uniref:Secreted protein n=1 Tax=Ixodes ricinus TaxID=34613 RepID=A0A147BFJ4_IXORI
MTVSLMTVSLMSVAMAVFMMSVAMAVSMMSVAVPVSLMSVAVTASIVAVSDSRGTMQGTRVVAGTLAVVVDRVMHGNRHVVGAVFGLVIRNRQWYGKQPSSTSEEGGSGRKLDQLAGLTLQRAQ